METENIKARVEGGTQWAAEVIALGEMPKSPMTTYHKRDLTQSIVLTNSLIHSKQLLETETGILGRVGGKGKERRRESFWRACFPSTSQAPRSPAAKALRIKH